MEKENKTNMPEKKSTKKVANKSQANKTQKPEAQGVTTIEKSVNNQPNLVSEEQKPKVSKGKKLSKDIKDNKNIAWLAYILFFIPLLINNKSPFVRHHANEGLEINLIDAIAVTLLLLGGLVKSSVGWVQLLMIIFTIIGFILIVLTTITKVYMILTTLNGKETCTPWMWNVRIIK